MSSSERNVEPVFSAEAVEILRRAYANPQTRDRTLSEPKEVLARHGIALADDVELRLYERTSAHRGGAHPTHDDANEPMVETKLVRAEGIAQVPLGLDAWWRATHMGCPFGTWPHKTKKKVTECHLWGVAASGKEWVPDIEGSPYGHWEYTNVHTVCILSSEVEVEVIECLPRFIVSAP
jgi:hypothetical protein